MNYETVVHSPVPLRDKIAAIVEYKIPVEKASGTSAVAWGVLMDMVDIILLLHLT